MHHQLENVNIAKIEHLLSPSELKKLLPSTERINQTVYEGRCAVQNILDGTDKRLLGIVGPCSIHDHGMAIEYAARFKALRDKVADKIYLVMRVYFEKPRTTLGWRGLLIDPDMDNSNRIQEGLKIGRKILLEINELGVPVGSEYLDPIVPNYVDDVVCWASIGARTIESQTHRDMASGVSVAVGFKNGTDGDFVNAINAMMLSRTARGFIGADADGNTCIIHTKGNKYTHLILRGGRSGPNYFPEHVGQAVDMLKKSGMPPRIIVDCSHGNSMKDHRNQLKALASIMEQRLAGQQYISGFMLESNLKEGRQEIVDGKNGLEYGKSVTDACISIEETEQALLQWHAKL